MEILQFLEDLLVFLGFVLVAPICRIYDVAMMNCWLGWKTTKKEHARKVAEIQAEVQRWKASGSKSKLCTSRPGWKSVSHSKQSKTGYHPIPVGNLNRVVLIDERKQEITVEPEMMMGQLTRLLVKMGWSLLVVPEVETLTVGGLVAGAGIESSSHKYGGLSDTAVSFEIVLPNGDVTVCSMENDEKLFRAIPHSYGTLGFITAVTFKLIRATPFVKLQYHYVKGAQAAEDLICGEGRKHEFIEGLGYPNEEFIIMLGDYFDGCPPQGKINNVNAWNKPLFHHMAKAIMDGLKAKGGKGTVVEYIPTVEYFHRHSRGIFWTLENANFLFGLKLFPRILGFLLPMNLHLQRFFPQMNKIVISRLLIQDYVVPVENWKKFYKEACGDMQMYPVWICPVQHQGIASVLEGKGMGGFGIDLGYYGKPPKPGSQEKLIRKFENFILECEGGVGAYADCYITKKQFHEMFNHTSYYELREVLGADKAFPTIYEKISPKTRGLE